MTELEGAIYQFLSAMLWVRFYLNELFCYCGNADDFKSTESLVFSQIELQWAYPVTMTDDQRLLAIVARSCPSDTHTYWSLWKSTEFSNLRNCMTDWNPSEWDLVNEDASVDGLDPIIYSILPDEKEGHEDEDILDCDAANDALPEALMLRVTDGCGLTLWLCPALVPRHEKTCPTCVPRDCPEAVLDIAEGSSSSTDLVADSVSIDLKVYIRIPEDCTCTNGLGSVTYGIVGKPAFDVVVPIDETDIPFVLISDTITSGTLSPSDEWFVFTSWQCDETEPCPPAPDCPGTEDCAQINTRNFRVPFGGIAI